jgi:hypothetical protein
MGLMLSRAGGFADLNARRFFQGDFADFAVCDGEAVDGPLAVRLLPSR